MTGIQIILEDGTYDGNITMDLTSSASFRAARVKRDDVDKNPDYFDGKGIYLLLIGNNTVYVGQTNKTIDPRIFERHRNNIHKIWDTVIAFKCLNPKIHENELKFIENAICESIHENPNYNNITYSPKKENCNAKYREVHYADKNARKMKECDGYADEIKTFIKTFPFSLFPRQDSTIPVKEENKSADAGTETFYYICKRNSVHGEAEIPIHCGHTNKREKRKTILKKGSQISKRVSKKYRMRESLLKYRLKCKKEGKIKDLILQEDITFDSPSGAGAFLTGRSFGGYEEWKTKNKIPLKELL